MVVEILNPGIGRKEDCLNLPSGSGSSSCSSSEWLLTCWYIKLQLVLTIKTSHRYKTGSLIKHHTFENLASTVNVRVCTILRHLHTWKGCISAGSLSNVSRDCVRAESDPLVDGDFQ